MNASRDEIRGLLASRSGPVRVVRDLLGSTWPYRYRILHRAFTMEDGQIAARTWRDVARTRDVVPDLARAAWHEVSGVRLHHQRGGYDLEPVVGPTDTVLVPVLRTLSDEFGSEIVRLAEWTGYGAAEHPRPLAGATQAEELHLGAERYSVWLASVTDLLDLVVGADGSRTLGTSGVLANYVWDGGGCWLVVADGDLASTYCGAQQPVSWPDTLEWSAVPLDAPLG